MSQLTRPGSSGLIPHTYGPQWLADLPWIFWAPAILLAIACVYLLWRSFFRSLPRSSRTCPKCGYDMVGISGVRCPECGEEHTSEKKLFRRRQNRNRKRLAFGFLFIAIAIALIPRVMHRGCLGATPTSILFLFSSVYDTEDSDLYCEAARRVWAGNLFRFDSSSPPKVHFQPIPIYRFDRWLFLVRAKSVLLAPRNPSASNGQKPHTWTLNALSELQSRGVDPWPLVTPAIRHPDPVVQGEVIDAVTSSLYSPPASAVQAMRACLDSNDPAAFEKVAEWLALRHNDPADLPAIVKGIKKHAKAFRAFSFYGPTGADACADLLADPAVAAEAALTLVSSRRTDRNYAKVLEAANTSPDISARENSIALLSIWSDGDLGTYQVLTRFATSDPLERIRRKAMSCLVHLCNKKPESCDPASQVVPALIQGLSDDLPGMRNTSAHFLSRFGSNAAPALPLLQTIADNPSEPEYLRKAATNAIAAINASLANTATSPISQALPVPSTAPVPVPPSPPSP